MEQNGPLSQSDSVFRKLIRAGIVIGLFGFFGVTIGMGYFSKPAFLPPVPQGMESVDDATPEATPAILGEMVTEKRLDGREWQSMVLTGKFNQDLDGMVQMSMYEEPAATLRARFEVESRREGWREMQGAPLSDNRLELWHDDGRMRIIAIDEYSSDLRSVTIFTGTMARRQ